ncbi:T9SS type A sorting domain-containing protein, partial [Acinetobacter baumannii]
NTIAAAHPPFASIGPNPASDRAEIIYYTGSTTVNEAIIYDMNGKEVWSAHQNGSYGSMIINSANFQSGICMVRFIANKEILLDTKLIIT